jgi:AraC family transcriptional regulator
VVPTTYIPGKELEEWHSHGQASISLLLRGTHDEYLYGKHLKRVPGDLKFVPAGEFHRCDRYEPGTLKMNISLRSSLVNALGADHLDNLCATKLDIKFGLIKLYHEMEDTSTYAGASAQMLLNSLLYPQSKKNQKVPLWVARLKELLQDEWNTNSTLEELARKIGVHPVTISRYFAHYFSGTLSEYMRKIKIERSLALMNNGSIPLTEIAFRCGFADHAHFTRTFKALTGYLPKQFRKL